MTAPPVIEINPSIRNPKLQMFEIRKMLKSSSINNSANKIIIPIVINVIPRRNNQSEIHFMSSLCLLAAILHQSP